MTIRGKTIAFARYKNRQKKKGKGIRKTSRKYVCNFYRKSNRDKQAEY